MKAKTLATRLCRPSSVAPRAQSLCRPFQRRLVLVVQRSGRADISPRRRQLHCAAAAKASDSSRREPIESQRVHSPLTRAATFLVVRFTDAPDAAKTARATLA